MRGTRAKQLKKTAKLLTMQKTNENLPWVEYRQIKGKRTIILGMCLRYIYQNLKRDYKNKIFTLQQG